MTLWGFLSGGAGPAAKSAENTKSSIENVSFEGALKELEAIVRGMEAGQLPLEEALTAYERGAALLDPFGGAGTTGLVARQNGRRSILIELNPAYAEMARKRIDNAPSK